MPRPHMSYEELYYAAMPFVDPDDHEHGFIQPENSGPYFHRERREWQSKKKRDKEALYEIVVKGYEGRMGELTAWLERWREETRATLEAKRAKREVLRANRSWRLNLPREMHSIIKSRPTWDRLSDAELQLQASITNPADPVPWHRYAAWLDTHGDPDTATRIRCHWATKQAPT